MSTLRTFLICAGISLFLTSPLYAMAEPFVILDSLKGKAEVQRAGQQKWVLIGKNGKLFNNDVFRVLDKSHARLKWQNGSIIFVNANSQILMNLFNDTINNKYTNYATVFFGAVYFVVKKTLPKEVFTRYETKVYTPTAILAIRGTSFTVDVGKKTGDTRIGIINGTVLVKNILKSQSLFLSAGYQTIVTINADPLVPTPLLEQDIAALKNWVPPQIVVTEMEQQIQAAKENFATITGKLEEKILVMPFANSSTYKGAWPINRTIADLFATQMTLSNRVRCSMLPDSAAGIDPIKLGVANNARYVIAGEIKEFDIIKRAEITAAADKYSELSIAKVCLELQIIDVANKTLIYKNDFCDESSAKNVENNSWKYISSLKFDLKDQAFATSILGKALNQTLDLSTSNVSRYLNGGN